MFTDHDMGGPPGAGRTVAAWGNMGWRRAKRQGNAGATRPRHVAAILLSAKIGGVTASAATLGRGHRFRDDLLALWAELSDVLD
jgi:hypothetical protein